MCGRYGRRGDKQFIAEHYAIRQVEYDLPEEHPYAFAPNYNITPESFQPVVRLSHESGEREFAVMKWGLVPYWSNSPKASFSSINARAETLANSGAWREPWKRRRCLIPAEFFYEWEPAAPGEKKQKVSKPWAVSLTTDRLFSFGGIWDRWIDKATGQTLESFSIITVDPNDLLAPFHNRCPLIVDPANYERWLTPYAKDDPLAQPTELLRTYPAEDMRAWRVKPLKGNGPELLEPQAPENLPQTLF
jgi:putative SOS response-associated peptidase YedK